MILSSGNLGFCIPFLDTETMVQVGNSCKCCRLFLLYKEASPFKYSEKNYPKKIPLVKLYVLMLIETVSFFLKNAKKKICGKLSWEWTPFPPFFRPTQGIPFCWGGKRLSTSFQFHELPHAINGSTSHLYQSEAVV